MGIHITQLVRNGYGMVAYQAKTPAACVDIPRPNLKKTYVTMLLIRLVNSK